MVKRKPVEEAGTDELVRMVVDALKPLRPECLSQTTGEVSEAIEMLRKSVPQFFSRDAIKQTRAGAHAIIDAITILESRINKSSPELRDRLKLNGALNNPELLRTITEWRPPDPPRMSETARDVPTEVVVDVQSGTPRLLKELRCLRDTCAVAIERAPTTDKVKEWCALTAWRLVVRLSDRKPREHASTVRDIASRLYESVTGKRNKDMKRICDTVCRERRALTEGAFRARADELQRRAETVHFMVKNNFDL